MHCTALQRQALDTVTR